MLGIIVLVAAGAVVLSYVLDIPKLRQWSGSDVGMAIPTAVCLLLLSVAVGLVAMRDKD